MIDRKLLIAYRDKLGVVIEEIDEYGVSFSGETVFFNDKQIDVSALITINKEEV